MLWGSGSRGNSVPLHTFKPEEGCWREGRQWTYSSTKIGGHQLDHLRLAGKDYSGQDVDLWASHPRRRFGGLPASLWLGLEQAKAGGGEVAPQPPSDSHYGGRRQALPPPPRLVGAVDSLEEYAMYRRYINCLYGRGEAVAPPAPMLDQQQQHHHHPHQDHQEPHYYSHHHHGGALPPPPPDGWLERHKVAAGGTTTGVVAVASIYKYLTRRKEGHGGEEGEDLAEVVVSGSERGGATLGEEGWRARMALVPRWSQLRRYRYVRSLGKGSHAETFLVERSGARCVLKESELLPEAVNEARLLSQVSSEHVVRLEDLFIEVLGHRHVAYLQLEYCDAGDLGTLIRHHQGGGLLLRDHTIRNILTQIAQGLAAMHDKHIIHRDLKPENILLTSTGGVKIADLGVSTRLTASLPATSHAAGSVPFMAPEVRRFMLGEDVSYNEKADIWALGALAYAMASGSAVPSIATLPVEQVVAEACGHRGWRSPLGVGGQIIGVLRSTLQPEPARRPTAMEVCAMLQGEGEEVVGEHQQHEGLMAKL